MQGQETALSMWCEEWKLSDWFGGGGAVHCNEDIMCYLKGEHSLRVFENRLSRKILRPERGDGN